jgi:hypothetical protein
MGIPIPGRRREKASKHKDKDKDKHKDKHTDGGANERVPARSIRFGRTRDASGRTVRAQVAEAEDAAPVRHDDDVDVLVRPVVDHGGHVPPVLLGEVHAPGAAEPVPELLAHLPHGGRVDQRRHLVQVVDQHAVVQRLVPVVQVLQHQVLPDVGLLAPQRLQEAALLDANVGDAGREQAPDPEAVPLAGLERRPLVVEGLAHHVDPARAHLERGHEVPLAPGPLPLFHERLALDRPPLDHGRDGAGIVVRAPRCRVKNARRGAEPR